MNSTFFNPFEQGGAQPRYFQQQATPTVANSVLTKPSDYLGLFLEEETVQCLLRHANQHDKKNFTAITEEEVRCFIGILYLSSYVALPRRRMLWERSPDAHNSLVSGAMQRDRFETISSALSSSSQLHELIDCFNKGFSANAPLDYQQTIGEAKHSMRFWCGCSRDGYCSSFALHDSNAAGIILNHVGRLAEKRRIATVVYEKAHGEPQLSYALRSLGVAEIAVERKNGELLPGLDKFEGAYSAYNIKMPGKRVKLQVVAFGLDVAMSNAYILYKQRAGDKKCLDLLAFRRNVAVYYLQRYAKPILIPGLSKKAKRVPLGLSEARFDGLRHFVVPQSKQTRCAHCKAKTTSRCQKCDVGVHVKCFVAFHTNFTKV